MPPDAGVLGTVPCTPMGRGPARNGWPRMASIALEASARAGLAAAWFDAYPPPVTEAERDNLLETLGRASPPIMWLPAVSFAEVPYYQPIIEAGTQKRVLHFDHFAVLSEGDAGACFCFDFEIDLSDRLQRVLAILLARMTYFGRAESRARLSLVPAPPRNLCQVAPADGSTSSDGTRRRMLVTRGTFSASDLWAAKSGGGHLVQAVVSEGRKRPPSTGWIDYALPPSLVRAQLPRRQVAVLTESPRVSAVRFGLFRRIPIPFKDLVPLARDIRDQAVANFSDASGESSRRLAGRESDGRVATGHRHAFWLPEPDPRTGHLKACTVWLPDGTDGIDPRELDALFGVQRIFRDRDYPILAVAERVIERCPEREPSRRWRPLTPFLAPLHSRRGRPELVPAEQLRRALEEVADATPRVIPTRGPGSPSRLTTVRAHVYRNGGWRWTNRTVAWFDLEFDRPVLVQRPLGADAHFGLGRFAVAG